MCIISVFNYLLSIFILLGGRVECRICKWKLLFVDRTFVAAFAKLTTFWGCRVSFFIYCFNRLSASKLLTV